MRNGGRELEGREMGREQQEGLGSRARGKETEWKDKGEETEGKKKRKETEEQKLGGQTKGKKG